MDFHSFLVMEKSWKINVEKEGAPALDFGGNPNHATLDGSINCHTPRGKMCVSSSVSLTVRIL